ncbi:MAG: hypothetical protein R2774_08780 [Saprospiraceae bacterium]
MHPYTPNLVFTVLLFILPIWDYFFQDGNPSVGLLPLLPAVILLALNNGVKYDLLAQTKAAAWTLLLTMLVIFYALWTHNTSDGAWKWEYTALLLFGIVVFILQLIHIYHLSIKVVVSKARKQ